MVIPKNQKLYLKTEPTPERLILLNLRNLHGEVVIPSFINQNRFYSPINTAVEKVFVLFKN